MNNTLPNTQVLLEYLTLYSKAREQDRKSAASRLQYASQKVTSFITARDPVIDQLNAITNRVISNINNATTFERWYELIFTLRAEADKAQSLKTLNDDSLLSETLHGLADLIICELSSNEAFEKIMHNLQNEKIKRASHISECIDKFQGNDVSKANNEYNKVLLELASLGDIKSINEAMERNKLHGYKRPNTEDLYNMGCLSTGNHAAPLCLQLQFCEWLYTIKFQQLTRISIDEFKKRAVTKGEQEKLIAGQVVKDPLQALANNSDVSLTHASATAAPTDKFDDIINPFNSPVSNLAKNGVFATQYVTTPPQSPTLDDNQSATLLDKEKSATASLTQ